MMTSLTRLALSDPSLSLNPMGQQTQRFYVLSETWGMKHVRISWLQANSNLFYSGNAISTAYSSWSPSHCVSRINTTASLTVNCMVLHEMVDKEGSTKYTYNVLLIN